MNNLLFLTPEMPWPPFSGGRIKSWKLVEHLSNRYQLVVGTLLKNDDLRHLDEFSDKLAGTTVISQSVYARRSLRTLLSSIVAGVPLNVLRNRSEDFATRVRDHLQHCDAVFVDHYEMMQYVPADYSGTVILHQHNAYHVLWRRFARHGSGLLKRAAALLESYRVKKWERRCCDQADLVFAAPNDIEKLALIGVEHRKMAPTLHLGDESHLEQPELLWPNTDLSLLYVGHLGWEPNVQGLVWFLKNVWPRLKEEMPTLKFHIIGANPDTRLINVARGDLNIFFEGFQEDLEPWMRTCRVMVAPLLVGSGIKVKVLTAMARGIPMVTTATGVEGLKVTNYREIAIADNASEMAGQITALLGNRILWERLSRESRRTIRARYTWKHVFDELQAHIDLLEVSVAPASVPRTLPGPMPLTTATSS